MAYTITISTNVQQIGADTLQMLLTFNVNATGTNLYWDAKTQGIRVADWGVLDWSYDIEDAFMVPAIYNFKLLDAAGRLENLFFGTDAVALATDKRPIVEIKVNGLTDYKGKVQEDGVRHVSGTKALTINADSDTDVINKRKLFADDGTPYNPFGYTLALWPNGYYPIYKFFEDIYGLIDPSISFATGSLAITHDWSFGGWRILPTEDHNVINDVQFTELLQSAITLYNNPPMGLNNLGDILRKMAIDWCAFTGMLHKEKAFFKKLFHYDASNLQILGKVRAHEKYYKYGLIDYVKVTTEVGRALIYTKGIDTQLEDRFLERDSIPAFYDNQADPDIRNTNVQASINRSSSNDGTYAIYRCADPNLLGGAFNDNGEVTSEFWYRNRGFIDKCRADVFKVEGVGYSYLKDFNDGGSKFQPIIMKKQLGNGLTEIEAVYLGEL